MAPPSPPAAAAAIVLCNLGTPDAPTPAALRRYLSEFLSDPRVVELPRALWLPILHGVVLRVRPARSAAKYASIWRPDGSPLAIWTRKQATLLAGYLGERGQRVVVRAAMRYGRPSLAEVLDALAAEGLQRTLVLPAYPQYSAATTASTVDAVARWAGRTRVLPELRFVNHFHDDPGYLAALARRVQDHWQRNGRGEKLILSFHGLPRRAVQRGDPYEQQCHRTASLLAERLALAPSDWQVTFQSRFGKAEWLQPYTEPTLQALARAGVAHVDVMCPGFVSDCLETLEEIGLGARAAFLAAGGRELGLVACLNDQHEWIAALAQLSIRHLGGWPTQRAEYPPGERTHAAQE